MLSSNFKSKMDLYKDIYFDKVKGDEWVPKQRSGDFGVYDTLMQNIIKELYKYVDIVESFERDYGISPSDYIRKFNSASSKPFSMGEVSREDPRVLRKRWYDRNKQKGYTDLLTITNFIHEVESILNQIRTSNDGHVISDALDVLSSKKTGSTKIDKDNEKLAKAYKESIEKEKNAVIEKEFKKVEEAIEVNLKNNGFYNWRHRLQGWMANPGRILKSPENQPIHDNSKITFKSIFDELKRLSKSLPLEEKHYEGEQNTNLQGALQNKIENLKGKVEKLSNYSEQINQDMRVYEVYLTPEERAEIEVIKNEIGRRILDLKNDYDEIIAKREQYNDVLKHIDALVDRERALDESISVLESNHPKIFPDTIDMLKKEKVKCGELLKNNRDTVASFEEMFDRLHDAAEAIDAEMYKFNSLITESKNRKNGEEKVALQEDERVENLARVHEIERIQPEIDRIKMEVIRGMALEGYEPLSYDTGDFEHPGHDYQAYNEVFYQRLKEELDRRGINYEGADLSNPYDTETFQKMIEEGTKQAEANQMPVLKDMGNHSYVITSEDYRSIFNLMKAQLDQTSRNYSYDDIEELAKQYIDRIYGLDNIRNQSEFEEIVLKQMREFNNERSSEK